ncbi:MAG: PKD domain-containing protein [Bacteroidetes bacterium]|nr:PKD domain-containing protein [Bacteroidota bacterium]
MSKKGTSIFSFVFLLMFANSFAGVNTPFEKSIGFGDVFNQSARFTENKGQLKHYKIDWSQCGNIVFYTQSFGGTAYFAENGIGFGFIKENLDQKKHPKKLESEEEEEERSYTSTGFFLEFIGKNTNSRVVGVGKQISKFNYYCGSSHISDVSNYDQVLYENLYNNIDLKYYMGKGQLKFDYIVKPGADISQIQLQYNGMKEVSVNKKGELEILTNWGILIDKKPYSYQIINGQQVPVNITYKEYENGRIGFEGSYDHSIELIIDPPTLTWATLIGGPNGDGYFYDITMDESGNIYGTGWYSNSFPKVSAADNVSNGVEPFVFKLTPDGTTLLYATFLGGNASGNDEIGTGIAVNKLGEAFVCGHTTSAVSFPTAGSPVQSVIAGGFDIFAAKFSATGALIYSTFYGATGDDRAYAIDIDALNNAFITGYTTSTSGFASGGAFQTVHGGAMDAFVLKLNPAGSAVLFCTYFGGTGNDLGRDIVVDLAGSPYIGGGTTSATGIASVGSYDATLGGDVDGFVAKFSTNGASRIYGAYAGGTNQDKVESVDVKCNGELVMSGYTRSDSPSFVSVNAIRMNNAAPGGGPRDAFMRRVSPDGSTLLNSTFMGVWGEDATKNGDPFGLTVQQRGTSVSVNRRGNIAVAFCTGTNGHPLVSPVQATVGGGAPDLGDAYCFVTDSLGSSIVFSTYFGGTQNDYPTAGVKYHPVNDHIFVIGGSSHSLNGSLPLTPGTYLTAGTGTGDYPYVVLYTNVPCEIKVDLPLPAAVCKGENMTFSADTLCGDNAPTFQWLVNNVVQVGATAKTFTTNTLNNNDEVCVVFSKIIPGCFPVVEDDTACVNVVIKPLPVVTLADDSICAGKNAVIDAGTGFDDYLWSSGEATSSITKSVAGTYWVEVTKNGCKDRDAMNLLERPVLFILPDSAKTCNVSNSGYVVTFKIGGGDPTSYKVTGLAGTLTGNSFTSNLITSGNSFSLIVTDKHNCDTVTFSGTLSCGCNPVVTLTSDTLICKGASAPIKFNLSGAVSPYDVVYTDGTSNFTLTGISDGFVQNVSPGSTTVYTAVSITDKNGCTALSTNKMTVTVAPVFQLLVSPSHVTCFGACNGSAEATPLNGDGPYTYFWSPTPPSGQGTATASQLCAGTYQVLVTDKHGCKDSVSPVLIEPQKLNYTLDSTVAHCGQSDGSAGITVVSGGNAPFDYQWDSKTGAQVTPTASNLKPGVYTIVLTDNKNCVTTDSVEVLNVPAVTFSSVFTNPLCTSDCNGSAALSNITGGTRPFTYTWTSPLGVTPTIVDSSALAMCAGNYKVVLKDKFNCKDSTTFNLVDPTPVQISVSPSVRTCVSISQQLTALANGGTPNYSYTWLNDATLSSTVIANPLATPGGIKKYTVSAKDVNNCQSPSVSVVLISNPLADFSFDSVPDCNSVEVTFTNTTTASTVNHSCSWDFGNATTSAICDPIVDFAPGNYSVKLTVTDDSSCVNTITKNLYLKTHALPIPAFTSAPQPTTIYDPLISFVNLSSGASSYSWHFGTGDSSKLINPYYTYADTGSYNVCLRVVNSLGCYRDTCSIVRINPVVSFFIANAFTPNGDNVNDDFKPFMTGYATDDYEFLIFDRWGELIFKTNDINAGWDGSYKGQTVQNDVYVWKIRSREEYNHDLHHRIGRVSVVR